MNNHTKHKDLKDIDFDGHSHSSLGFYFISPTHIARPCNQSSSHSVQPYYTTLTDPSWFERLSGATILVGEEFGRGARLGDFCIYKLLFLRGSLHLGQSFLTNTLYIGALNLSHGNISTSFRRFFEIKHHAIVLAVCGDFIAGPAKLFSSLEIIWSRI